MGRPARFSYDDIAQACDVLDGRGILSADNVLTHLGGGSKTTILRHYNAWLAARRAAATRPLTDVASEAFREALVRELDTAAARAREAQAGQLAEMQEQLQTALTHLHQAEEAHATTHEGLLAACDTAEARARELEQTAAIAEAQTQSLREHNRTLESRLAQLAETSEGARTGLLRAESKVEALQQTTQELRQQVGRLEQHAGGLQDKLSTASEAAAVASARLSERKHGEERLTEELQAARAESTQERADIRALRTRADDNAALLKGAEARVAAAETRATESATQVVRLKNQMRELEIELARLGGAQKKAAGRAPHAATAPHAPPASAAWNDSRETF